jgi:flagellar hook-associated protein 1 FlgK
VRAAVDEINTLAAQIAELNGKITHAVAIDLEALKDQRNVKIARLAELAGATAVERGDGPIDVVIGPGQALVVGAQAFRVDVTSSGPQQLAALSVSGTDITNQLRGGQLAALTDVRDVTVPGYQAALDQLAWGVATQVNGLHAAGFDLSGAPAGNFFTVPGSAAGAAAAIAVDAAVAANSALVAGSLTGAVGDNQTARAIAALRDTRFLAGGTATATEAWGQLVYQVGAHLASAQSDSATYGQVVRQLQRLRDSTSGVSLDEEAAMLMKYQRAYEANARYFLTISDTLDTLLGMVR